jgi:hypothetical protein
MGAIGAAAVGTVGVVTVLLGSSRKRSSAPPAAAANLPGPIGAGPTPASASGSGDPAGDISSIVEAPVPSLLVLIPRAEWGAQTPQVFASGRGERAPYDPISNPDGWLVYPQPPEEIIDTLVIHHSALPLSDGPVEIQRLHMEEKGFADVGYQFLINETGALFEGRALNVRGAHTFNFNYASIGICLIGNFEEIQPTAAQLGMLDLLLDDLQARFPRIYRLAGHKDFNSVTLCPGENLHALLPEIAQAHGIMYGIG